MSKKLLIIGDGNHQFITNYVKWLNQKGDFEKIDVLSSTTLTNSSSKLYCSSFSLDRNNKVFQFFDRIKGLRRFYRFSLYRKLVKKLPHYDFIHAHFLNVDNCYVTGLISNQSKKILSVWGSDFYRSNHKLREYIKKSALQADAITFTNEVTRDDFIDAYKWDKDNLYICRFGLAPLDEQKNLEESRNESKSILGWNEDKIAVAIGYNLSEGQQHLKILDQLDQLKEYSDRLELILPITYGDNLKYKQQLISKLEDLPFSYVVYDKFLSDLTISRIRNASDIMIQLQITDQFSGSMQEHLFARNVVITGSWLPYQTMKEHGVKFIEIDNVSELSGTLENLLDNFDDRFSDTVKNPSSIEFLSSWDKNISNWLKLYNL